jgi:hypothetical protein
MKKVNFFYIVFFFCLCLSFVKFLTSAKLAKHILSILISQIEIENIFSIVEIFTPLHKCDF